MEIEFVIVDEILSMLNGDKLVRGRVDIPGHDWLYCSCRVPFEHTKESTVMHTYLTRIGKWATYQGDDIFYMTYQKMLAMVNNNA